MALLGAVLLAASAKAAPVPASVTPTELRVNYIDVRKPCVLGCSAPPLTTRPMLQVPLAIDDPAPTFSWRLEAEGARGAKAACTLAVKPAAPGGELEEVLSAPSNATQFVPLPAGLTLKTDTEYSWTVTCGAASATSSFSTGLLSPSDWGGADWIGGSEKAAVLMRKKLTIEGAVTRARIFVAVPGYGQVSVNGVDVDGVAGTRTWSQYDVRTLCKCTSPL